MNETVKTILGTPEEARKILNLGRNCIYELIKEKDFPSFKLGGKWFINLAQLQAWADRQCLNK